MSVAVDLLRGDCLAVLAAIPDESIAAIVTDPPYGLADHKPGNVAAALTAWASGDRGHVPDGRGFMGRAWDGFVPPPAVWDECLRVLRPGGHLLAFAGSRTADLMGLSVRLAGFEIRDTIMWVYGSGMPKGQNVGKAIDKAGGDPLAFRRFARSYAAAVEASSYTHSDIDRHLGVKSSSCYWVREDHRGGLPPRHHWEQVRDLLGLDAGLERLYDEAEREVIGQRTTGLGTGGGTVRLMGDGENRDVTAPATPAAAQWEGWNTSLKPAQEPIIVARKPLSGTVAATVLAHGTGAIHVDACRVGTSDDLYRPVTAGAGGSFRFDGFATIEELRAAAERGEKCPDGRDAATTLARIERGWESTAPTGRWPANVVMVHAEECVDGGGCVDGCPVAELDRQSGIVGAHGGGKRATKRGAKDDYRFSAQDVEPGRKDVAPGASRFFPTFRYQAKAPTSERPKIDGKGWPTVKPQGLMRWLVRLVTPPGGLVLDPFAGTGATLQAARAEGFDSLGIERDPFAYQLACQRLDAHPTPRPAQLPHPAATDSPTPGGPPAQLDLFGEAS